jgi:hypothetical protein
MLHNIWKRESFMAILFNLALKRNIVETQTCQKVAEWDTSSKLMALFIG